MTYNPDYPSWLFLVRIALPRKPQNTLTPELSTDSLDLLLRDAGRFELLTPAQELELVAGTVKFTIPKSCTGGFGNALVLSVDGAATTFASVPGPPTSGTVTVPFLIGTLSEPGQNTDHKLTAKFTDTCSKAGEDYKIDDVKIDVLKFH